MEKELTTLKKSKCTSSIHNKKNKEVEEEKKIDVRPWAELHEDILIIIAKILSPNAADFVRFGAVSKSWKLIASTENYPPACKMPMLMLAEDGPKCRFRRFFSPSEGKIYKFPLPEARDKMCCTSVGGYVVTIGIDLEMHLLDPFSRDRIKLPSLDKFDVSFYQGRDWRTEHKRNLFIGKVCLSASPLKKEKKCFALAFYGSGKKLAFVKIGDPRWTSIRCDWWPYEDAIFYKGQFYVVNCHGDAVALDLRRRKAIMIAPRPNDEYISTPYLVELSGDLLQVMRYRWTKGKGSHGLEYKTCSFRIYKLVESRKWEQLKSLGGRSLFVGRNNSFSVAAQGITGCKEDCIYFTDDYVEGFLNDIPGGGHDMGIYNVKNGRIEPFFAGQSLSPYSPPLWIEPFMWWK